MQHSHGGRHQVCNDTMEPMAIVARATGQRPTLGRRFHRHTQRGHHWERAVPISRPCPHPKTQAAR